MNRSLKLSILLALALGSSQAAALDLGQIQVKSALGQPLLAEIPVNPGSPAELQSLTARLASAEDAAQAGIAASPTVPLQFSVVDGAGGHKVIRITSAQPVNDPYLDFLVEVNNATGKSLREFTILLDPPGTAASVPATSAPKQAPAKSSRRAAPASTSSTTAQAPAPAPAAEAPAAKPAPAPRAAAGGTLAPVERGQTLSAIAHENAPAGVDLNQMLLALKQANPDAFYRDNINALKTGAVLRVPSKEDAQATAVAAAAAEVMRQNSDWRSGAARAPTTVADAGTRANASSAPTAKGPAGDHLALVPAKEGSENAAGRGSKGDKAAKAEQGMNALHQDLLRSQEALTTLQQQGDELKSRLKDLEDINSKNERLLALKDNEIAELQHKLADARKASGQPAAAASAPAKAEVAKVEPAKPAAQETVVKASEPVATTPAPASSAPATTAPASEAPASEPAHASTATAATPAPAKPAVTPAKPKPAVQAPVADEEPWYMQTWAWGAGAGVAVLLLLLGLRGRGRKAEPSASPSSLADRFGTVPPINTDSLDPDQDELLDQLAEHPDDIGLHLELVSLYYSRRDIEHFEAAAEAMHAHIVDPQQSEWQDVVHMGEDLVPEHPLFSHGAPLTSHGEHEGEHDALDHFDLDRYADEKEAVTPPPMPSHANKKVSEYHFDFDLTPRPVHNGAHAVADAPATSVVEEKAEEDELQPQASSWEFAEPEELPPGDLDHTIGQFSDDPVDTKLDLARAYLDMGDPDGAQAMLEEVIHEGTQMQKDVAKRLLDSIR